MRGWTLGRAEILPSLLMTKINEGSDHEAECLQTRCRGEVADNDVDRGEVHSRRDGSKRDGLGQRPAYR